MSKIYIIEDDVKIRDELALFLTRNGYTCESTDDFKNIIELVVRSNSNIVLLDINLPYVDGYHICKEIRKISDVPIVVVTSQDTEMDELMSISFGADDFITKPYNTQILLARIQAVLRRTHFEQSILTVGEVQLNMSKSCLFYKNIEIDLTKNEMRILNVLMTQAGHIVSRDDIMDALWQSNDFIDDNTLTVNINRLRKKMESVGIVDFLITKRGQGYMV